MLFSKMYLNLFLQYSTIASFWVEVSLADCYPGCSAFFLSPKVVLTAHYRKYKTNQVFISTNMDVPPTL